MKTVICYYSCHHGNTRKVVQAMAEECGATLLDLSACLLYTSRCV